MQTSLPDSPVFARWDNRRPAGVAVAVHLVRLAITGHEAEYVTDLTLARWTVRKKRRILDSHGAWWATGERRDTADPSISLQMPATAGCGRPQRQNQHQDTQSSPWSHVQFDDLGSVEVPGARQSTWFSRDRYPLRQATKWTVKEVPNEVGEGDEARSSGSYVTYTASFWLHRNVSG